MIVVAVVVVVIIVPEVLVFRVVAQLTAGGPDGLHVLIPAVREHRLVLVQTHLLLVVGRVA